MASLKDIQRKANSFFSQANPFGDTDEKKKGRQNAWTNSVDRGVRQFAQSPAGQFIQRPPQNPIPQFQPFKQNNFASQVGNFGASLPSFIANEFIRMPLNTATESITNFGRGITGRAPIPYSQLKSPIVRNQYIKGGLQPYSLKEDLGNKAGIGAYAMNYAGMPVLKNVVKASFEQAGRRVLPVVFKESAKQAAKFGGLQGGMYGLEAGRTKASVPEQLLEGAKGAGIGIVAGGVLGGVLGTATYPFGRAISRVRGDLLRRGYTQKQADVIVHKYGRYLRETATGKFVGKQAVKQTVKEEATHPGFFNKMLDKSQPTTSNEMIPGQNKLYSPARGTASRPKKPNFEITPEEQKLFDEINRSLGIEDVVKQEGKIDFNAKIGGKADDANAGLYDIASEPRVQGQMKGLSEKGRQMTIDAEKSRRPVINEPDLDYVLKRAGATPEEIASGKITVYRATENGKILPGDFVSPNKDVLKPYFDQRVETGRNPKIVSQKVDIKDLVIGDEPTDFVYRPSNLVQSEGLAPSRSEFTDVSRTPAGSLSGLTELPNASANSAKTATPIISNPRVAPSIDDAPKLLSDAELKGQMYQDVPVSKPPGGQGGSDGGQPIDVSKYVSEQVAKQKTAKQPIKATLSGIINEIKQKFTDETSALSDTLNLAEKQGKFTVLPRDDIRIQIDKALRSDSIATQFMKDKGFTKVVQQVPDTNEFNQYLIAKHALRVGDKGIQTGRDAISDQELVRALSPKYEAFAKQLRGYQDALLEYKVESGFITRELADALKKEYPDYVPLNRIFTELEENIMKNPTGRGGVASVSTQNVLHRLKGSEREIANPLESILEQTGIAFRQGERNRAAQMLAKYKELPGNPFGLREITGTERIGGKYTVSAFINGQKRTFETFPEIAEAARNLDAQQFGLLGQLFAYPTRVLKLGATGLNIPFIAGNFVKDQIFSTVTSKRPLSTSIANPKVFGKALYNAIGHGKTYDDWVRSGASFTSFDISRNTAPQTLSKIRAGKNIGSKVAYTVKDPREWLRAVENIVGRGEELTRIQQFEGTKQALLKQGRTLEDATLLAQQASNFNTANFARKGSWSKVVNGVLPFFSAGIAGARSLVRSAKDNPAHFAVKFGVTVGLPTATVTAWNLSDPLRKQAYDDIADFEKNNNLIIVPPDPVKDEFGKWNVIKIPITPGLSNLMSIVRRQVEGVHKLDPQTALAILGDIGAATTSLNFSEPRQLVTGLIPQAVKPAAETMLNKNFFTGRDIVPFYMKNKPPEEQVWDDTSATAREIGRVFNTSPLYVENAVGTSFAGVGRQALNASDRLLYEAGLIPEEQIGGKSIGEDIQGRFTKATGGEIERKEEQAEIDAERSLSQSDGSLIMQLLTGKKADAATSTIVNKKIKYRDFDGSYHTLDLTPETKGQGIDQFSNQNWKYSKAREVWKNKDQIGEEGTKEALSQLGVNEEDVRYDYLSNHTNDIKTQYILSKNLDHEQLLERLMTGRVESVTGELFAANGVIDNLEDQGYLSDSEAKALKNMKFDNKGNDLSKGSKGRKPKKVTIGQPKAAKVGTIRLRHSKVPVLKLKKAPIKAVSITRNNRKASLKIVTPTQGISYKIITPKQLKGLSQGVRIV